MLPGVHKNILSTIIYYDILDYPLTSYELWRYLLSRKDEDEASKSSWEKRCGLADVIKILDSDEFNGRIEKYRGFYFLPGRKELVRKRLRNNKISEAKYKKILRTIRILKYCPFVRMIAVTGTVAMKNAERKSDLDFLVVIKAGRIFTGRILFTAFVHIMGMRRYAEKITDRICLNHFITDETLEISLKDTFSSSEYSFILPVFGSEIFKIFQEANNWISEYAANYDVDMIGNMKAMDDSWSAKTIRAVGEAILKFDFIEKRLKKWQTERIVRDPRTHKDGGIIMADDDALVFLPDPQGPKIEAVFKKNMCKVLQGKEKIFFKTS